jgi:hypothetical protein
VAPVAAVSVVAGVRPPRPNPAPAPPQPSDAMVVLPRPTAPRRANIEICEVTTCWGWLAGS